VPELVQDVSRDLSAMSREITMVGSAPREASVFTHAPDLSCFGPVEHFCEP
jgi:hypothetical protein